MGFPGSTHHHAIDFESFWVVLGIERQPFEESLIHLLPRSLHVCMTGEVRSYFDNKGHRKVEPSVVAKSLFLLMYETGRTDVRFTIGYCTEIISGGLLLGQGTEGNVEKSPWVQSTPREYWNAPKAAVLA